MQQNAMSAYGLWALVVINSAVFIFFAFSFFKPQTKRDWRSFGAFSAFLVALVTEMYGYAHLRHPQYLGFILIMLGFLLQWPTLLTLAMFPILVWMYARLAKSEEREARAQFGKVYAAYAARTPGFIPRLGALPSGAGARADDSGAAGGAGKR